MILIDTSAWISFFRGKGVLASKVDALIEADEAALCGPVLTELRRGLRSTERRRVLPALAGCHELAQPDELWTKAGELGFSLARRGATVKTLDLLIATYALHHRVALLTEDSDFKRIATSEPSLRLA